MAGTDAGGIRVVDTQLSGSQPAFRAGDLAGWIAERLSRFPHRRYARHVRGFHSAHAFAPVVDAADLTRSLQDVAAGFEA